MIRLITDTPGFFNDIGEVIRLFLGEVVIRPDEGDTVYRHTHRQEADEWVECFQLNDGEIVEHRSPVVRGELLEKRMLKRAVKTCCFLLMVKQTGVYPPWGSLTGIRPTRLMYELTDSGLSIPEAAKRLQETFYVSPEKAGLLSEILLMQQGLIERPEQEFDLYLGIPFCTTRCAYCSFSSGELGNGKLVEPYVQALLREIELCARMIEERGLRVRAAYMGGGTPTAIPAGALDRILASAQRHFPGAREWTVEAGRPDTIDREKLSVMLERGVQRISVNPQTFSDVTLQKIGRAHTSADTLRAYELARSMGFEHINMDLIAALPEERVEDFRATLEKVMALNPESVTVHSLAIKRSSKLHEQSYTQCDAQTASEMVDMARHMLMERGWKPYYLYRQKYMAGNLENVGYAKPGCACLYNIDIMEETTPILALGANGITKWLYDRERRIERAPNVRNIEQYIARVDEMAERKRKLIFSQ